MENQCFSLIKNYKRVLIFYCFSKITTKKYQTNNGNIVKEKQNFKRICSRYFLNKVFYLKTQLNYKFQFRFVQTKLHLLFFYLYIIFAVWQTVTNL